MTKRGQLACKQDLDGDGKIDGISANYETREYWNKLVKPYLREEYKIDFKQLRAKLEADGRFPDNAIDRNTQHFRKIDGAQKKKYPLNMQFVSS